MKFSLVAFGILACAVSVRASAGQDTYKAATSNPCVGVGKLAVAKTIGTKAYATTDEAVLYKDLIDAIGDLSPSAANVKLYPMGKGWSLQQHALIRDFKKDVGISEVNVADYTAHHASPGCKALREDIGGIYVAIDLIDAASTSSAPGLKHPGLSVLAAATIAGLAHTARQF